MSSKRSHRFIVEADGGSRGNPGPAAYGTVVRDGDTGEVLVERAEHIGTNTNNVAEYRGLIAGLTAVRDLDPEATVEARLDSKLVVEQMSGRWKIKHPAMRPLALRAKQILPPDRVTYVWVPRERNRHADRLANEALDAASRGEIWSEATSNAALDVGAAPFVDEAEVEPASATEPPERTLVGWDTGLGNPTTTVLLRHGDTAHTVRKLFSGSGGEDPPLAPTGEKQALAAAAVLASRGITQVLSSPMRRARQTADIVAASLGLPVRVIDDLRECAFGEWEGCTFAEVRERWPERLDAWLGSTSVAPPGGESFDFVDGRVLAARDRLLGEFAEQSLLLVSHVTPIKTLVRDALRAPADALFRMELASASVTEIYWFANGSASLRSFNERPQLTADLT